MSGRRGRGGQLPPQVMSVGQRGRGMYNGRGFLPGRGAIMYGRGAMRPGMHTRGRGAPAKKPMRIVARPGRGRTVKPVPSKGRGVTVDVSSTMKSKSVDQDYEDADDEVNGELSGASEEEETGAAVSVSVA